jgi:hypothetical protein
MGVEDVQIVDPTPFVAIRGSEDHSFHAAFSANPAAALLPGTITECVGI